MSKKNSQFKSSDAPNQIDTWPRRLTFEQLLHQFGYLMREIITRHETPSDLRDAINGLTDTVRSKLAEKEPEQVAAIEARVTFAPLALALAQFEHRAE